MTYEIGKYYKMLRCGRRGLYVGSKGDQAVFSVYQDPEFEHIYTYERTLREWKEPREIKVTVFVYERNEKLDATTITPAPTHKILAIRKITIKEGEGME